MQEKQDDFKYQKAEWERGTKNEAKFLNLSDQN
jgi:hypothetical protein